MFETAIDSLRDGEDLLGREPFATHLKDAAADDVDGFHSGFPCSTFSRARFNGRPGPKPVRTASQILGLATNTPVQQAEADRGTLGALRSVEMCRAVSDSARARGVPQVATVENPAPPVDEPARPSAFYPPDIASWLEDAGVEVAQYNFCAYGPARYFKP